MVIWALGKLPLAPFLRKSLDGLDILITITNIVSRGALSIHVFGSMLESQAKFKPTYVLLHPLNLQ